MGIFSRSGPAARSDDIEGADREIAHGQEHEDAGRLREAEECYRRAIEAAPRYPRAHLNLGNALQGQGRLSEAAQANREAVAADPSYAPGQFNLGVVLMHMRELTEAKSRFARALELVPSLAGAALYLSRIADAQGDLRGAIREMQHAIALDSSQPLPHAELAALLLREQRVDEARAAFRRALEADAACIPALLGLGRLEMDAGNADLASEFFRRGTHADPRNGEMWAAYLMTLNVRADIAPEMLFEEHRRFGRAFDVPGLARPPLLPRQGRRIRVGYVSGDFRASPVAWFISPVLEHHEPDRFETFCYANVQADDFVTADLRGKSDHWRSIWGLDDAAAARMIRDDGIDVLVDLTGHSANARLGVFALRPAPVQATWVGYLNTTGLAAMDYRVTDAYTDPVGASEHLHTERLLRMPHSQWCWVPYHAAAEKAFPDAPSSRPVVFGSFNHAGKINGLTLDLWARVLDRVPGSRLRIHAVNRSDLAETLCSRLGERGIARERIETVGQLAIDRYFDAFRDVDIAFDAFPYNGGTTTFVTYWMGVPMVALVGERGIARGGYSIASSAGFEELIARDAARFVEMNVALAHDGARRLELSRGLRRRLMASPLADAGAFTRALEALYDKMLDEAAK